jgi:hypothetical protein
MAVLFQSPAASEIGQSPGSVMLYRCRADVNVLGPAAWEAASLGVEAAVSDGAVVLETELAEAPVVGD